MKDAVVELSSRDKSVQDKVALDAVVPTVKDLIAKMTKEIDQNNKKNEAGLRKSEPAFFHNKFIYSPRICATKYSSASPFVISKGIANSPNKLSSAICR